MRESAEDHNAAPAVDADGKKSLTSCGTRERAVPAEEGQPVKEQLKSGVLYLRAVREGALRAFVELCVGKDKDLDAVTSRPQTTFFLLQLLLADRHCRDHMLGLRLDKVLRPFACLGEKGPVVRSGAVEEAHGNGEGSGNLRPYVSPNLQREVALFDPYLKIPTSSGAPLARKLSVETFRVASLLLLLERFVVELNLAEDDADQGRMNGVQYVDLQWSTKNHGQRCPHGGNNKMKWEERRTT